MDCQSQPIPVPCGSLQAEPHLSISAAREEGRKGTHVIADILMWRPLICGATVKEHSSLEWNWLYSLFHVTSIKRPQNIVLVTWICSL